MELRNDFHVSVPVEQAWDVLTDLPRIAPCMPGAQLQSVEGEEYHGVVKVKVGPITAQLLGSLIVAETWSATLERAGEDDPAGRPASVVIDEVQQYLHLPVSIDDALSRSRSYGVGWHLAHQHRAQLPPSTRAAVDTNAKSKIVFQPLDPDDASAMAKQAPDLQAVDFLSLGQYQAYVNLTAGGTPAGWALVRTLPPPDPTGLGQQIRTRSRERYANPIPTQRAAPSSNVRTGTGGVEEVGRKRRAP